MIELDYFTFGFMIFFYFIALGFIFYRMDYIFKVKNENKILKFELEIKNILIDSLLQKGKK